MDLLAELEVPFIKLGSGEVTNLPLLRHAAKTRLPIILSTGMSTMPEVDQAVSTLRESGTTRLVLLHCVSAYPTDPAEANLRAMATMCGTWNVPVGFSDHTTGVETALAAVALGASVIEKHITLDRALPGPDHRASLEPAEMTALVCQIRNVSAAMGDGCKQPMPSESETRAVARRSIAAASDLAAGTLLEAKHLAMLRPGTGLAPYLIEKLLGRSLKHPIKAGALLTWDDVL